MSKRIFKVGGNLRTVVTVGEPVVESDADAGTVPAIDSDGGDSHLVDVAPVRVDDLAFDVDAGLYADTEEGAADAGSPIGCEPDVINVLQALRADDDGMGLMLPVHSGESVQVTDILPSGWSMIEGGFEVSSVAPIDANDMGYGGPVVLNDAQLDGILSSVTDAALDVVASEPVVAEVDVVTVQPVTVAPIRVALDIGAVDLARFIAGHSVELTVGGVVIGTMLPLGKAPKAARVARVTSSSGPVAAEHAPSAKMGDSLEYDASEVCKGGNLSNVKVWQRIRDAAARLDLDSLLAESFAGSHDESSGNTYTRANGRFLRAHIANVKRLIAERDAALDAEYGYKLAAD